MAQYEPVGGLAEIFSIGGGFKIVECLGVFICCMLHTFGNRGEQIFFGATDLVLHSKDNRYETEADAEIIGTGAVTAFCIITPLILIAYVMEGRDRVQRAALDAIFTIVGGALLITAGGMTCFAWSNGLTTNANVNRRDYEAAGALGVMSLATGIVYVVDFFYVLYRRSVMLDEEEDDFAY